VLARGGGASDGGRFESPDAIRDHAGKRSMTFTPLSASGPASVVPLLLLELELLLVPLLEPLEVPLEDPLDDPLDDPPLLAPLELAPLEEPPPSAPMGSLPAQAPPTHCPEMQSSSLMQASPRLRDVSVHAAIAVPRPTTTSVTMDAARTFERALMVSYDNKVGGRGPRKPLTVSPWRRRGRR
jgi:hypothetical protein